MGQGAPIKLEAPLYERSRSSETRKLIARVFDYSLDGVIATEGTKFFQFCRDLPDDPAEDASGSEFYAGADLHIMGRAAYQSMAGYFPTATDDPNAEPLNAARKVVFSRTLTTADWASTTIASGDLAEKLTSSGGAATATSSSAAASGSGSRSRGST